MIRVKGMGFKVFEKMRITKKLEDFVDSKNKGYRTIVEGIRMVTFLRNRLNQGMLPRFRVGGSFEDEAKKTAKHCANSTANSLRNLGGIPSRPDALFVFREDSTLRTLRVEMMVGVIGLEMGKGGGSGALE